MFRVNLIVGMLPTALCCHRLDDYVGGDYAHVFCVRRAAVGWHTHTDPAYAPPAVRLSLHDNIDAARHAFLQLFASKHVDTRYLVQMMKRVESDKWTDSESESDEGTPAISPRWCLELGSEMLQVATLRIV